MYDYIAQSLKNVELNIAELSQFEQEISSTQDKDKKQQLRKQAEQTRANLLGKVDASVSYLYLSATQIANADEYRSTWQKQHPGEFTLLKEWGIEPLFQTFWKTPLLNITILPAYSFILQFRFKLSKSYISRNDNDFYIIDNPLVRDKIFQLPMVRPTSWKGSLQATLWQLGYDKEKNDQKGKQVKRIFGMTDNDRGTAGRLFFYPTFFHRVDLEVINPHDRKTGVGARGPILIESVPEKTEGGFFLLYVPFDRIGEDETETRTQAAEDLRLVAEGIRAMVTMYGFGAKTSSGFGVAEENLVGQGQLHLKATIPALPSPEPPPAPPPPDLPRYLSAPNQLHADFRADDGSLRSETGYRALLESRGQKYTKRDKQLYDKAKSWWEREGQALAESEGVQPEPSAPVEVQQVDWPSWPFDSFSELVSRADEVAEALKQGGAK